MIRGVGRGFISGWWGLGLIVVMFIAVMMFLCCWCLGFYERRRRRLSLAQHVESDLTLREDSPKFLKMLANKENMRRLSNINIETHGLAIKNCVVEYSGSISPYPSDQDSNRYATSRILIPMLDD